MELCHMITGVNRNDIGYIVHTNCADILLCFVTEEIVRVRVSFDRRFDEASYVLCMTAWEDRLDPLFVKERTRVAPVFPAMTETEDAFVFETKKLRLVWAKHPFGLSLYDADGVCIYKDLAGTPYVRDANGRIIHYSSMKEDDCFYGFGEKTGPLNKNKQFLRQKATDALGYDPLHTDTLYKHIPFYIRLDRRTQQAVGLFYNNFYESVFNMGCEKSNYWSRYSYWQADGGDIDLFLLAGGKISSILEHYTKLTGRPALLPKRAFGYQASSMYYPELESDCDRAIIRFIETARELGFPTDGFHLSSGYTTCEGKRCVFTWNSDRFPNPGEYIREMDRLGAPNVPNVKPGVLLAHPEFDHFAKEHAFVKDSVSDQPAVGKWWGGDGAFWDYTNPKARSLWKRLLTERLLKLGIRSVWNDNCEYDSLLDQDCRCCFDGQGGTIRHLKPIMSTLMCKLAIEAIEELDPDARPYVVCRSGSAGIQAYAQTWCGDNRTGWDSLRHNIPVITGMGLSGQPHEGSDIGGFYGPAPSGELFVRWVQHGIFQPRFSIHSASSDHTVTEPWMYSGYTSLIRDAIRLRYRLTPYLYAAQYESTRNGAPLMRALVYEFQHDPNVYDESFDFLFGRDILVANVLEPGLCTRRVYLPDGCRWYDWNDDYVCYDGGQTIEIPVTLETIPLFIREGAIIPMADNEIHNMEQDPVTDLRLLLVPGISRQYELYNDDGSSNSYRNGVYKKWTIRMSGTEHIHVDFTEEGTYLDPMERIQLEMVLPDQCPYAVRLDNADLHHYLYRRDFEEAESGWYYSMTKRAALIKYKNPKSDYHIAISMESVDLIDM